MACLYIVSYSIFKDSFITFPSHLNTAILYSISLLIARAPRGGGSLAGVQTGIAWWACALQTQATPIEDQEHVNKILFTVFLVPGVTWSTVRPRIA